MRVFKTLALLSIITLSGMSKTWASELLLNRFFDEVGTLTARFDQSVTDETGFTLEESSGVFYLSRPGKFRWDYKSTDPELEKGQQIVADGNSIFMYDPDLEQVTQRGLEDSLGQVPSLLLVQTGATIEPHFDISDYGSIEGLSWVGLKPKDPNAGYQQLMIGFLGEEINTIKLIDGLGNETRLSLTVVKSNIELAEAVFEFVPPENADVLVQ